MCDSIRRFAEFKEDEIESLIRGGLLRREDAYDRLCIFAATVRRNVRLLKVHKEIFHEK